jgi:hypothetical protein
VDITASGIKTSLIKAAVFLILFSAVSQIAVAASVPMISIDGNKNDWMDISPLVTVEAKTPLEGRPAFVAFYAARSNQYLVIRADLTGRAVKVDTYTLFMDTNDDVSTGFISGAPDSNIRGMDYMLLGKSFFKFNGTSQRAWSWHKYGDITCVCDGHTIESAIPLEAIEIGKSGKIKVVNQLNSSDWRNLIDTMPHSGNIPLDFSSLPLVEVKLNPVAGQKTGEK